MPTPILHRGVQRAGHRGFTLVEIMVAMLIGLIGSIVIFQVLTLSERQKRTTTGAGNAQQNGLLALFAIERDARMAGFGLNYLPLLGCNVIGHDSTGPRNFAFELLAVRITEGAAGAPDSIGFVYGNSSLVVQPSKLTLASGVGGTQSKVNNRFGLQVGDVLLVGEAGRKCSIREVTDLPGAVGVTDEVIHTVTGTSRFNRAGGLLVSYSAWDNVAQSGGRVYSLGAAPVAVTYSVQNAQLVLQNLFTHAAPIAISDGIVQMQAEYGKDIDGDGDVDPAGPGGDLWEPTMPAGATATDWSRVLAVRIAVVARSAQPEPGCQATTVAPRWKNDSVAISVAADPNWQCYRYRVLETTVPVRNMIWVPQ